MNNAHPNPGPEIEIARISQKTAVFVALITAIGGVVGGYFIKSSSPDKASPPIQRWLIIHSVKGEVGAQLKLVARVNSIPYSYPADVVMTVIGADMPEQKCPLPFAESYTISFEAYFRHGDIESLRNAKNRETPSFAVSQLPIDRHEYRLHEVIGGAKLFHDRLTVTYSIR